MKQVKQSIAQFIRDEEAATASEYGIIAAFVGTGLIFVFPKLVKALTSAITTLSTRITSGA